MKIIIFLAATILSLSAYSQAFMQPRNMRDGGDMNNAPLKKPSIISNAPFSDPLETTEYSYDTVRALNEINVPNMEDVHPWISADGLRLYYTSGFYNDQLVMAERADINSYFGTPTLLPIPHNWGISYWLSTDELDLYFADGWGCRLYYSHRDAINQPFSFPYELILGGFPEQEDYLNAQSLNSTQFEVFIHASPSDKIMEFEGYWPAYGYIRTLPAPPGFHLIGGQLSKDDLTYFTSAEDTNGNYMLYQMTRATPQDTFDISTFQLIEGINDTSIGNAFPTMSDSLEWVAFNKNTNESWEGIDLYLAHNGILTSVFNPVEPQILCYVFPNPSSENFYIKYKSSLAGSIIAFVYSYEGVLVFEDVLKPSEGIIKINTSSWNNGVYSYRITQNAKMKNAAISGKFVVVH
jgi:hypothetical protein